MYKVINTKKDLEAIKGTPQYDTFIAYLDGDQKKRVNKAVYPEKYDNTLKAEDEGYIAPVWEEVKGGAVARLGLTDKEVSDKKKTIEDAKKDDSKGKGNG